MGRHKLTLVKAPHHDSFLLPKCMCGWQGLPRARRVAETEYRNHKRQQEARVYERGARPRPLTPYEDLPPELQAQHPDIEPFEAAIEDAVRRIQDA